MIVIPELPDVQVEAVAVAAAITLTLRTTSPTAACPTCGTASPRIHSRYTRTLRDLPSGGRPVRLIMHVRRFVCSKRTCAQKIFAERLPDLCHPHAQRTKHLQAALCQLGLSSGGQAGADTAQEHILSGSRDTILRLVRRMPLPPPAAPRIIGLDDWAYTHGRRYGTLICDLERGQPIDLLPDRTVATVEASLQQHPSVEVVSRDGSAEYASARSKGAPHARQVSDRWHLVKNLAECVAVLLTKVLAHVRRTAVAPASESVPAGDPDASPQRSAPPRATAQAQQARHDERLARYAHMMDLHHHGMRSAEIAHQLGMTERSIQRSLASGIPYTRPRKERARCIDPYKAYIVERIQQGCRNAAHLERELRAKGYTGSGRALYRYLETLMPTNGAPRDKASGPCQTVAPPPNPLFTLSAQQATWLFFRRREDLTDAEQATLHRLRQASPDLETTYQLVDAFLRMVRERTGEQLEAWLEAVAASHLDPFAAFVSGVEKDKAAVRAGLTLPWSTGPLEGQVNRLKLIKKTMYGRAGFDLLKIRVLYQRHASLERKTKAKQRLARSVDRHKKPRMMNNDTNPQHTTTEISEPA